MGLARSVKCGAHFIPSPERAARRVWRKQARGAGFTVGADRPTGWSASGGTRGLPRSEFGRHPRTLQEHQLRAALVPRKRVPAAQVPVPPEPSE